MTTQPLLKLHLHLTNGKTHKFVQNEPQAAQHILDQIDGKVFSRPSLLIGGPQHLVAYPGSALVGITVLMKNVPDRLLHLGHPSGLPSALRDLVVQEITEAEYWEKVKDCVPAAPGQPFLALHKIEFVNGDDCYTTVWVPQAVSGPEERALLHHVFARPCIPVRRMDGGVTIWNVAGIVSHSFCPSPEAPEGAWPAEWLDGNN